MRWFLLIPLLAIACSAGEPSQPAPTEPSSSSDWSKFGARGGSHGGAPLNPLPEEPVGITGVPYIRAIKLAWTSEKEVPSYEDRNETREIPSAALQAVLRVDFKSLPEDSHIRVEWYFGDSLAFRDEKRDRSEGPHDFALTHVENGKLMPLPAGVYRADLFNGTELLKTVPFEVAKRR